MLRFFLQTVNNIKMMMNGESGRIAGQRIRLNNFLNIHPKPKYKQVKPIVERTEIKITFKFSLFS